MFSQGTPNNNNMAVSALLSAYVCSVLWQTHLCYISFVLYSKCLFFAEEKTEV